MRSTREVKRSRLRHQGDKIRCVTCGQIVRRASAQIINERFGEGVCLVCLERTENETPEVPHV
jgi:hypothetical protein